MPLHRLISIVLICLTPLQSASALMRDFQLATDPALTQKRLGDGFYEQKLIREQIAELTGRRFLTGYSNDETEYQALMTAGVTFAQDAVKSGRFESWVVRTMPDGSTKVQVLDALGNVKQGVDVSKILKVVSSGVQP